MPQGGPLTPLAALFETLKRENRAPTQQEKDFIAAELAKGVPKPSERFEGQTAPPAGAPVPSTVGAWFNNPNAADTPTRQFEKLHAEEMNRVNNPSVTDPYRGDPVMRGMTRALDTAFNFLDVPAGLERFRTGVTQANNLLKKDPLKFDLNHPTDEVKQASLDIIGGGLQAIPPIHAAIGGGTGLLASALPMFGFTLAQDKANKLLVDMGMDPLNAEGLMDVVGAGMMVPGMGHGSEPVKMGTPEYKPWYNISEDALAKITHAANNGGGSFNPFTGEAAEFAPGDAAAALGRQRNQFVTAGPDVPITGGEILNFLDTQKNAFKTPDRMLGVYPGKKGRYAEVSQAFRGPNAEADAMRAAALAPIPQESIFVATNGEPRFPEVPKVTDAAWDAVTAPRPGTSFSDLLAQFNRDDTGAVSPRGIKIVGDNERGYVGINPATGRKVIVGIDKPGPNDNSADRTKIVVGTVPTGWDRVLKGIGYVTGRQISDLEDLKNVFQPRKSGYGLELTKAAKKRDAVLNQLSNDVVKADWEDSPTFLSLANDLQLPQGADPRVAVARMFGATSPKVALGENMTNTMRVLNLAKMIDKPMEDWGNKEWNYATQYITSNAGSKIPNIRRALLDQKLSSYPDDTYRTHGKTEALAQLLASHSGEPFDIHNLRALGFPTDHRPTNGVSYQVMEDAMAQHAAELGVLQVDRMAGRWAAQKMLTSGTETPNRSPEQMMQDAGITHIPGTEAFRDYIDTKPWGDQGQLVGTPWPEWAKSMGVPLGVAAVMALLPDDLKKKILGDHGDGLAPALGMTFFMKPGVTGEGYREHGTASETGRVPDVARRKSATAVNMAKLKELLDTYEVPADVQERIGMIAGQYPRVMAHLTDIANLSKGFGEDNTMGLFSVGTTDSKRGKLSLDFLSQYSNPKASLSEAFAHELQHAGQNIQVKDFGPKYEAETEAKGYWKNQYEERARAGATKRELEAHTMQMLDKGGEPEVKAASKPKPALKAAITKMGVPSKSVTPPGTHMAALAPKRIAEIMEVVKADTKGLPTQENMDTLEKMLKRPEASLFSLNSEYPRLNAKDEPKFILPSGHVIAGPIGMIHTKFAGQTPGSFNHIMELGAHRISYDKAENDIGQGIETWTPFGWRAADSIAQLHETAAFGIRPSKPESIATLVDVHKTGDASKPLAYRYTDYLGGKSIYDLTADKLRAFADSLFAKVKK